MLFIKKLKEMQETVTTQEFGRIPLGKSRTFTLADRRKVRAVRVQANAMKENSDMEFSVNKVAGSERRVGDRTSVKVKITRNK